MEPSQIFNLTMNPGFLQVSREQNSSKGSEGPQPEMLIIKTGIIEPIFPFAKQSWSIWQRATVCCYLIDSNIMRKHRCVCLYFYINIPTTKKVTSKKSSDEWPEPDSTPYLPSSHKTPSEAAMNITLTCLILRVSVTQLLLSPGPEGLAYKGLQKWPQAIS